MTIHNSITNQERFVETPATQIDKSIKLLQSPSSMTETALKYVKSGLSVIPTNKNKRPALQSWTPFQHNRADLIELSKWWITSDHSIATICGKVSGNLELIDFDEKYNINNSSLFEQWRMLVEIQRPGLVGRLVTQTTINKGFILFTVVQKSNETRNLLKELQQKKNLRKNQK